MVKWRAKFVAVTAIASLAGMALAETPRPRPRPLNDVIPAAAVSSPPAQAHAADSAALPSEVAQTPETTEPPHDPSRGAVTNLPLPRFVSLKTGEGNARRGPGLTHRIDWVFTKAGMPLKITAEYENWRRVEDADGLGGWVHYSLLSGVRTALVKGDMVDFHTAAREDSALSFRAEAGVVARILSCENNWCRVQVEGERGWVPVSGLWGVEPGETIE